ncbi:hypothetical protein D3C78_1114870 [compost metagenome]
MVGLEAAQLDLHPRQLEAVAQHLQGAVLLQGAHHLLHQYIFRGVGVGLGELVPALRPGFLDVVQQVFGIQRTAPVVAAGRPGEPALGDHGLDDVLLELSFLAVGHYTVSCSRRGAGVPAGGCQPRRSILPVTAAEIRAERRS